MLFNVVNLGCKVNRVESDACAAALVGAGWSESPLEAADLVVVNTCTVTGEADKKTRKAVRHALAINPFAPVLVTGCAAAISPDLYRSLDQRVEIVGKASLNERVLELASSLGASREGALPLAGAVTALPVGGGFRTRVGVKAQDGCDNACTYCIVHVARGRSTSRPLELVASECGALARAGVREIVLTGINLGRYRDRSADGVCDLVDLLQAVLAATREADGPGDFPARVRIGSIEPRDVDARLVELLASSGGRIARHLHLPLQSGNSKVLREMARPYSAEMFEELVCGLRASVPEIALSTDIIAGFPGETEAEFEDTLALARRARFMKIHAFPYSRREGTPAAARDDQVPAEIKTERASRLRALSDELAAADLEARRGTTELALVEGGGRATLESYHEADVGPDAELGALVPVTV